MEIPYTVTARPDTGLYNAKVGIWLFLASEVMLFGGLFSSYVFLRIGADFPWPRHELHVLPGFINTMVLIVSSVSVVAAWASLKARRYGWFQVNMVITLLCALGFMGIKSFEYYGKFHHYSVILQDGSVMDGHRPSDHPEHYSPDSHNGDKVALTEVKGFSVNLAKSTASFLKHRRVAVSADKPYAPVPDGNVVKVNAPDGTTAEFNEAWLKPLKKTYRKLENLRSDLAIIEARIQSPKTQVEEMKRNVTGTYPVPYNPAKADKLLAESAALAIASVEKIKALKKEIGDVERESPLAAKGTLSLQVAGDPLTFLVDERHAAKYNAAEIIFRDDVILTGKVKNDAIPLNADVIDLRQTKDPEKSLVWKYYPDLKAHFFKHKEETTAKFVKKHPDLVNEFEKDLDWQHEALRVEISELIPEADYEKHEAADQAVNIERSDKRFYSNFSPSRSPYYAIYFLMTGLHGLHVIGGAIVLGYFLLTGRKMYKRNPEHLANRVEVGGLFWHFVDLVWIFLFPVFYLL
jgi:heme/copper-type cytochrome/quinol oxidase subunit 3